MAERQVIKALAGVGVLALGGMAGMWMWDVSAPAAGPWGAAFDHGGGRAHVAQGGVPRTEAGGSGARPLAHGAKSLTDRSASGDEALLSAILSRSGLDAQWLRTHGFTPGSAALQRLHGLLDGRVSLTSPQAYRLGLGPQNGAAMTAAGAVPVLSPYERFVEASVPAGQLQGDSVLLRWRKVDDARVMELSAQVLPWGGSEATPVWMYSDHNWEPGRYRVEVLAPNTNLDVLAQGEFEIARPGRAVTPFSYPVIAAR